MLIHLVLCFNISYLLCVVPFLWKGGQSIATCILWFENFVACLKQGCLDQNVLKYTLIKRSQTDSCQKVDRRDTSRLVLVQTPTTSLSRADCYGSIFLLFLSDKTAMYWKMISFAWHDIFIMS